MTKPDVQEKLGGRGWTPETAEPLRSGQAFDAANQTQRDAMGNAQHIA